MVTIHHLTFALNNKLGIIFKCPIYVFSAFAVCRAKHNVFAAYVIDGYANAYTSGFYTG